MKTSLCYLYKLAFSHLFHSRQCRNRPRGTLCVQTWRVYEQAKFFLSDFFCIKSLTKLYLLPIYLSNLAPLSFFMFIITPKKHYKGRDNFESFIRPFHLQRIFLWRWHKFIDIPENQQNLRFVFQTLHKTSVKSGLLDINSILCIVLVFMIKKFLKPMS